jgi:hypothetical protein
MRGLIWKAVRGECVVSKLNSDVMHKATDKQRAAVNFSQRSPLKQKRTGILPTPRTELGTVQMPAQSFLFRNVRLTCEAWRLGAMPPALVCAIPSTLLILPEAGCNYGKVEGWNRVLSVVLTVHGGRSPPGDPGRSPVCYKGLWLPCSLCKDSPEPGL